MLGNAILDVLVELFFVCVCVCILNFAMSKSPGGVGGAFTGTLSNDGRGCSSGDIIMSFIRGGGGLLELNAEEVR